VELSELGLRVTTEIRNTGVRAVPVTFGWHPYLHLPGVPRSDLAVVLPDRERLEVDGRRLPTGETRHEAAATVPLGRGDRTVIFDDCYRLTGGGVLAVRGPRAAVEVELDERYGYGQVYAPAPDAWDPDGPASAVVALEPMTAPVDALVSGDHRVVPPGERDSATFVIRVVAPEHRDGDDRDHRDEEPTP
jgi:aldose 1-epimerase